MKQVDTGVQGFRGRVRGSVAAFLRGARRVIRRLRGVPNQPGRRRRRKVWIGVG